MLPNAGNYVKQPETEEFSLCRWKQFGIDLERLKVCMPCDPARFYACLLGIPYKSIRSSPTV